MSEQFPANLREVYGAERAEAVALLEYIEQAASSASYTYRGAGGDYFLYFSTTVDVYDSVDSGTRETAVIEHTPSWEDNNYHVTSEDGATVTIQATHTEHFLSDSRVSNIMETAGLINSGNAIGTHRTSILKYLEYANIPGTVLVMADITRTSDDRLFPVTTVDLRLIRDYYNGSASISQCCQIVSDPNTGAVHVGDSIEGEECLQSEETEIGQSEIFVPIPFPKEVVVGLSILFSSSIPIEDRLPLSVWTRVVSQPLQQSDRLRRVYY